MKTIKIGGITYKIVYTELEDCGKTDFNTSTIFIANTLNKEQRDVTLIHEVLHCINNEFTEEITEFLAQALYQVIIDNSKLK